MTYIVCVTINLMRKWQKCWLGSILQINYLTVCGSWCWTTITCARSPMSWANSSSWPLLASRYVYPIFIYILHYIIQSRAIPLGPMCCSCSLKWMERESFWTSCLTTWQCLPATHSPGKNLNILKYFWYVIFMFRPWIQLQPLDRANPTALFTVMCYNVLCDRWLHSIHTF